MHSQPIFLLPRERILRAEPVNPPSGQPINSALKALMALCSVRRVAAIGSTTPVIASTHRPEQADVSELTKYEVVFGRDSLIAARFVYDQFPRLTAVTVRALARYQGTRRDCASEEEPGRIPHEIRDPADPVARAITEANGWKWPYYGAIDATPLFISAIARLARSDWPVHDLSAHFFAGLDWLLQRLAEGDGLMISDPTNPLGIENQVWRDSWDAFSHCDGSIAKPPLAPIDAQIAAYDACNDAAELLQHMGADARREALLRRAAEALRSAVLDEFWVANQGRRYPAQGIDWSGAGGGRRLIGARASSMGHLLGSKLLDGLELTSRREAIVRTLFDSDLLCAAGIRTLGSRERRYRPAAYHNGSSWPWDTATIAFGLRRHGYRRLSFDLMQRVLAVCRAAGAFPEFARGDAGSRIAFNDRVVDVAGPDGRSNRIEQPPQAIQAFTVSAVLAIKWLLGRCGDETEIQRAALRPEAVLDEELSAVARWSRCPQGI